jgi:large subunit ribosomal protein L18
MLTRKNSACAARARPACASPSRTAPRLTVFRSNLHIYASVISGRWRARCWLRRRPPRRKCASNWARPGKGGNAAAATLIGKRIAEKAKAAGIEKVAFDRSGFAYHGRVKALAEAAREAGLQF